MKLRKISKEEHQLLAKMFMFEYMGWMQSEWEGWYDFHNDSLGKKIFDLINEGGEDE